MTSQKNSNMKSNSLVELHNISLFREGQAVLKNLNWTVSENEHWVILGPNGSGKSSLVALLQGWLWPIDGEIKVLGRLFGDDDLNELRQSIGWVGNELDPELPSHQSCLEIVLSGSTGTLGIQFDTPQRKAQTWAKKWMTELGIWSLCKKPYRFCSQGQKRLTMIVRALMTKPGILLLDEPSSGLDPVAREIFLQALRKMMQSPESPLLLYTTHHVDEIMPEFTHALLLREGQVSFQGPIDKAISNKELSRLFSRALSIKKNGDRWQLRLE